MTSNEWQPIESAPKDGTIVDLKIVGADDWVDFYAPETAKYNRKTRQREGIAVGWAWIKYGPNDQYWRDAEFPDCVPLSRDVTPTHWRVAK